MNKKDLAQLPQSPRGQDYKMKASEYVYMITTGSSKYEAFKAVYPERYEELSSKSKNTARANVMKGINALEQGKYVQELFVSADKQWYTNFFDKRHKVYDRAFKIAMDEEEDTKTSLNAMNLLLKYMPSAPKEMKIEVEVSVEDDFKKLLANKKLELHKAANDIIDVEVE